MAKPWDGKGHGRIPSKPDQRDVNFQAGNLIRQVALPMLTAGQKRTLRLAWQGDQKATPMCVGFTGEALLRTQPSKWGLSKLTADQLYSGAQMYDEIPGTGYEGSTTRGLLEFLVKYEAAKDIQSYWWVKKVIETVQWIGSIEATAIPWGTNWYTGLYSPDKEGIARVKGVVSGGHEYTQIGYDLKRGLLEFQNSWGAGWGKKGRFFLSMEDAERLLHEDGECAIATKYPKYKAITGSATVIEPPPLVSP